MTFGVKPDPAADGWEGSFQAVYPDGARRRFDLNGQQLREGERLPGTNLVLERWQVSEQPAENGRFTVVGFLNDRRNLSD